MNSVDHGRGTSAPKSPGGRNRAGFRISGLCLVLAGPIILPLVAYACYNAQITTDLCLLYLFIVLPVGFLLLGYSASRRWSRVGVALGFLVSSAITVLVFNAILPGGEPGSAVHRYTVVFGPPVVGAAFVMTLVLGLIFVPRRTKPGHCHRCGYDLKGLLEQRCPECGTPFDVRSTADNRPIQPNGAIEHADVYDGAD